MVCMHRVDNKRQQAAILRAIGYAVTIFLTATTTAILLYVALGYRLGSSGHVVKNGLLLVDNRPQSAQVYINGEQKDSSTPSRFVLPAGNFQLDLKLDGYRNWTKQVRVSASKVREVNYPLLIPKDLSQLTIASLPPLEVVSQSHDRKLILVFSAASSQLNLIELDSKEPVITPLTLGSAVRREDGQIGTLKVLEWSLNNKNVLLEQSLPSGAKDLLSVDVTKPSEAINISTLYADRSITDVHYVGGETKQIYGLRNGILSRYDLSSASQTIVMQNIMTFVPYGDDTVLFSRQSEDQQQIGIWKDSKEVVVSQVAASLGVARLLYAQYDEHFYLVVGFSEGEAVTVFRDPLKRPILTKQLPYTTLAFSRPQQITFSGSAQFFMLQNGPRATIYDLEDVTSYAFEVPFATALESKLAWVDDHRIQAVSDKNVSYIFDYDGTNQQQLTAVRPGSRLYYSNNYEHYYSFGSDTTNTALQATSLVFEKP